MSYMPQIIYMITCKTTGKKYIGKTINNLNVRWNLHLKMSKSEEADTMLITNAIKNYGKDSFEIIELLRLEREELTEEQFAYLEAYFIQQYDTLTPNGYNKAIGSNFTQDTKDKISARLKAHIAGLSDEEKQKRISHLQQFKPLTDESRQKMIEDKKKKWENPLYQYMQLLARTDRYLITSPNNVSFCSIGINHLREITGITPSKLYPVINKQIDNYKGWKIELIESEETKVALNNMQNLIKTKTTQNKPIKSTRKPKQIKGDKYHVIPPNGEAEFCIIGLSFFARQYNLETSRIADVISGRRSNCKGWKIFLIEKENPNKEKKKQTVNSENFNNYEIIKPNGETVITNRLSLFAKEHNLCEHNLRKVARGEYKQHKGYKCRKIEI